MQWEKNHGGNSGHNPFPHLRTGKSVNGKYNEWCLLLIYFIVGSMGNGKTLTMTYLGLLLYQTGNKIYSNYPVKYPHTPILNPDDIKKIKNGVFLGDELWSWLDARESHKSKNKFVSSILLKSRKKGYDIFHTAQFRSQPDKRLREHTDFFVIPEYNPSNHTCKAKFHQYYGNDRIDMDANKVITFNAKPVYKLYNSYEGIYEDNQQE